MLIHRSKIEDACTYCKSYIEAKRCALFSADVERLMASKIFRLIYKFKVKIGSTTLSYLEYATKEVNSEAYVTGHIPSWSIHGWGDYGNAKRLLLILEVCNTFELDLNSDDTYFVADWLKRKNSI